MCEKWAQGDGGKREGLNKVEMAALDWGRSERMEQKEHCPFSAVSLSVCVCVFYPERKKRGRVSIRRMVTLEVGRSEEREEDNGVTGGSVSIWSYCRTGGRGSEHLRYVVLSSCSFIEPATFFSCSMCLDGVRGASSHC